MSSSGIRDARPHRVRTRAHCATALTCALACAALAPRPLHAQYPVWPAPAPELRTGITGTLGGATPASLNPVRQLAVPEVRGLVMELAGGALPVRIVHGRLADTGLRAADLVASGIMRAGNGRYHLDFGLFTAADVERLSEVGEQYGATLAEALLDSRAGLEPHLLALTAPGVDVAATRYIVLGCFMLNWYGGLLASELGYAGAARVHGNGGTYSLWAMERTSRSLERLFWGSHNAYFEAHVLTSFGDHHSLPRLALPDLMRSGGTADTTAEHAATMMLALRDGPLDSVRLAAAAGMDPDRARHLLALLRELDYVGDGPAATIAPMIPVLADADLDALRAVRSIVEPMLRAWLEFHYGALQQSLRDVTPLRHDVPFSELFVHVWHEVFGVANRTLVDAGWFADPYARRLPGFMPAVWARSLSPVLQPAAAAPGA